MKLEDIVLVTDNNKGTETNMLMTLDDYLDEYVIGQFETEKEVCDAVIDIMQTKNDATCWSENYFASNKTVHARFCNDRLQLVSFLQEASGANEDISFDADGSSRVCIDTIRRLGITVEGKPAKFVACTYEKLEREYAQGEILHHLNGCDYRVLEKLSDRNMLLMSEESGQFIVALGMEFYKRYPKGEESTEDNTVVGIEWGNGRYYGYTPSEIDFATIRQEYGYRREEPEQEGKREYSIEVTEILSRVITVSAEDLDDATQQVEDMYRAESFVLDAEDLKSVDYKPVDYVRVMEEKSKEGR